MKTLAERFWSKVDRRGDWQCWPWLGTKNEKGYGYVGVEVGAGLWRMRRAHRVSYELFVGPIPKGLTIDHSCRNRSCVNPAHLRPMRHRDNVMIGTGPCAKNARKTHCKQGHEFAPENTYYYQRKGHSQRCCKVCQLRRARERASTLRG